MEHFHQLFLAIEMMHIRIASLNFELLLVPLFTVFFKLPIPPDRSNLERNISVVLIAGVSERKSITFDIVSFLFIIIFFIDVDKFTGGR